MTFKINYKKIKFILISDLKYTVLKPGVFLEIFPSDTLIGKINDANENNTTFLTFNKNLLKLLNHINVLKYRIT